MAEEAPRTERKPPPRAERAPAVRPENAWERIVAGVARHEARLQRRNRKGASHPLRAIALAGLIGWSVVLPMVAGIALGTWIDRRWPNRYSWTLMLLVAGLAAGCANAWNRIKHAQEDR